VPTSVIVTLLGAAVTVWLAPAFTRQWDDRQAARDLKVELAEHGLISAFQTIRDGARLAEGQGRYDAILGRWSEAELKTDLKAKAYFGESVVDDWQSADQQVRYFLLVSADIAAVRVEAGHLPAGQRFQHRYDHISRRLNLFKAPAPEDVERAPTQEEVDGAAHRLADDEASERAAGMEQVKTWILAKIETAADALLSAHPSGFSTTREDLLKDLLP
jgi:hypothetical protein